VKKLLFDHEKPDYYPLDRIGYDMHKLISNDAKLRVFRGNLKYKQIYINVSSSLDYISGESQYVP